MRQMQTHSRLFSIIFHHFTDFKAHATTSAKAQKLNSCNDFSIVI